MTAPDPRHVADLALKIIDTVTGHDSNVVISALVTAISGINSHFSNDRDNELRNAAVIAQAIMAAIDAHRDDMVDDVAFWKDRAEAAEKALAQHAALGFALKQALGEERKSVWRDVLLTVSSEEALSTVLEEEREACAKVAEANLGRTVTAIAAAIRARKETGDAS